MSAAKIFGDKAQSPTKLALIENGKLAEMWLAPEQEQPRIWAIHLARVSQIFKQQNRAECQLVCGTKVSFRLQKSFSVISGGLVPITLSAMKRQHKPWQAELGISRAGRFVVMHAHSDGVRLSHKAKSKDTSLIDAITPYLPAGWGAVIKRSGLGVSQEAICDEMHQLVKDISDDLLANVADKTEPQMLYAGDTPLEQMQAATTLPATFHLQSEAAFWDDMIGEAQNACQSSITLASGIVIHCEPTEALIAIDVDSGASRLSPLQTALASAEPIMTHIRLASLSGVIVVDMPRLSPHDKDKVIAVMRDAAQKDRRVPDVLGFSRAGLIEIIVRHQNAALSDRLIAAGFDDEI